MLSSGRRVGLSIGQSEDLRVVGSRPGCCLHCCVVSILSLLAQVYKWELVTSTAGSNPAMD